jgi:hypothetical protein
MTQSGHVALVPEIGCWPGAFQESVGHWIWQDEEEEAAVMKTRKPLNPYSPDNALSFDVIRAIQI